MNITINVDETMFADVVDKELKALPKEKIQEIVVEGIAEYLRSDNYKNIEPFIYRQDYYGSSKEPSALFMSLIKDVDKSKLQDVVDKCIEELKNNYTSILIKLLSDALLTGLLSSNTMIESLRSTINYNIEEALYKRNN